MGRTHDRYNPGNLREAHKSDMPRHCSEVAGRVAKKAAEEVTETIGLENR